MKDTIHRICPCHRFDIEGIQTWLEDMAKEGWVLEKGGYGLGTFTFLRSQPARCRYRLEVVFESKKTYLEREEYLEMLKEFGWTHVTEFQGFDIFCTEDLNARELNTDPAIQAMTLKHLRKHQIINFIFGLIYLTLMTFLRRWSWFRFYYSAVAVGPLATVLFLFYLLYTIILLLTNLFYLHRLLKKLRQGVLLNSSKPWRPFAWLKTAGKLLPALTLCLCLILFLHSLVLVGTKHHIRDYPQDPPFVTLEDLANDEDFAEYENFMDYNTYTRFSRSVSPLNLEWSESVTFTRPDGSTYSGHMILSYHETCGEWFAQGLADDYYTKDRYRYNRFQELDAPDLGVDSIRVYSNYNLYVLIQHDNIVVQAVVSLDDGAEEASWLRWAEAMAQMLLAEGS